MGSDEEGVIPSPHAVWNYTIPEITLQKYMFDRLDRILKDHGDRIWAKEMLGGKEIMLSEVKGHVRRVGSALCRLGFKPGEKGLFYCNNFLEFPIVMFALWCLGGTVTLLDPKLSTERVAARVKKLRIKFMFCDLETASNAKKACQASDTPVNLFYFRDWRSPKHVPEGVLSFDDVIWKDDGSAFKEHVCTDFDAPVAYLSSSGTTGEPKSIIHGHRTLIAALEQIQPPKPLLSTYFASSQLYHLSGWFLVVWCTTAGVSYHFASIYEEESWLKAIHDSKPYRLFAFTFQVNLLAVSPLVDKYDLSTIRYLCTGAGSISPETMEKVQRRFPQIKAVLQAYGSSEFLIATSGLGFFPELQENQDFIFDEPVSSVLYSSPYTRIKIVDLNSREPLGPYKRGEICVKSPTCCSGYLDDPKATAELFDSDGWIVSGDEGYYDEVGRLYITGRLKNIIKYRLDHVSPGSIEEEIQKHPDVVEAAVVGVPAGDIGELPRAYVALKPGSKLTAEDIGQFIKDKLMDSEQLRGGCEFMPQLPRNKTGKVLYTELQKLAAEIPVKNGEIYQNGN